MGHRNMPSDLFDHDFAVTEPAGGADDADDLFHFQQSLPFLYIICVYLPARALHGRRVCANLPAL